MQNTYEIFKYLDSGVIEINSSLSSAIQIRIQNIIDLVGLDRLPGHQRYSIKDKRWEYRMNTSDLAKKYANSYKNGNMNIDTIVDLAISRGFFGIWMQEFKGQVLVEEALIFAFKSTFANCRTKDLERN